MEKKTNWTDFKLNIYHVILYKITLKQIKNYHTFSVIATKWLNQFNEGEQVLAAHHFGIIAAQYSYLGTECVLNELDLTFFTLCHFDYSISLIILNKPQFSYCTSVFFWMLFFKLKYRQQQQKEQNLYDKNFSPILFYFF